MKKNNYAFIDAQNLYLGIKLLGWKIDWLKFRIYLKEKYSVNSAFLFIGYINSNQNLYSKLQKYGFILIFKPTTKDFSGSIKGNCDGDLILHTIIEMENYDKAVIITSDGDFYSLIRYLYSKEKLEMVLSPHIKNCSKLLRKEAKEKINFMDNLKNKIGKNEKAPHKDKTL
jgi:uncharacterized LabA/DUF88 family protein